MWDHCSIRHGIITVFVDAEIMKNLLIYILCLLAQQFLLFKVFNVPFLFHL